jgi:uncharacterized protein
MVMKRLLQKIVNQFLTEQSLDPETIEKVIFIIENMSFKPQ